MDIHATEVFEPGTPAQAQERLVGDAVGGPHEPDRLDSERVVHLVGELRRDGHNLLWPTVLALTDAGVAQTVVLSRADDVAFARSMLPRSVSVLAPGRRGLLGVGANERSGLLRETLCAGPLAALHLHGYSALRLGVAVLQECGFNVPLFLHFGGDPAAMTMARRWMSSIFMRIMAKRAQRHLQTYVVHRHHVSPVSAFLNQPVFFLRQPVRDAYFEVERKESDDPLIVTSGRANDLDLARAFAQIAVLLAGSQPRLHFAWIGATSPAVRLVLQAAHVRLERAPTSELRAAALASAWIYLAPDAVGADGVPLAQAMAVGLPCVVADTVGSRDLVIHRLCGLVSRDRSHLLKNIARLVDSKSLRRTLGHSARGRAHHQVGFNRFRASLLLAHGLSFSDSDSSSAVPVSHCENR